MHSNIYERSSQNSGAIAPAVCSSIEWPTGIQTDFGTQTLRSVIIAVETQSEYIPSNSDPKQAYLDWISWKLNPIKI